MNSAMDKISLAQKHTPEPWVATDSDVDGTSIIASGEFIVADCQQDGDWEDAANAARIVACVNACAGMAEPAAEIYAMRASIDGYDRDNEALHKRNEYVEEENRLLRGCVASAGNALRGMLNAWHDYLPHDKQKCLRYPPEGIQPERDCDNTGVLGEGNGCEVCTARAALAKATGGAP